jgi:MFS family permease
VSGARTLLRAAANPNYRRVLGSLAVSASGDWLYVVGFMVWVFARTHSPGWVAAAAIMRLLPYVVFGTLGGAVVDRYGPRRVMVAADLIRIGIMLVLMVVIATGAPVLAGIVLAAVSTTVATVYRPSRRAARSRCGRRRSSRQQLPDQLRIPCLRQRGEPDQIREEHRALAPLGAGHGRLGGRGGRAAG